MVEYVESNPVEEEEKEEEAGSSTHGGKGVKEESGSGRGHDGSAASGATPKRKERKRKAKEEEAAAKAGEANGGYMDEGGGEEDMKDALSKTEAKKARAQQKENQYDSFLKQQRLHPELAGVYAEEYMTAADAQINKHYLELKVFRGDHAVPDAIAGIVQFEPHTTFRDVRLLLQEELGFDCEVGEELVLSRTTYSEGGDGGNGGNGGGRATRGVSSSARSLSHRTTSWSLRTFLDRRTSLWSSRTIVSYRPRSSKRSINALCRERRS